MNLYLGVTLVALLCVVMTFEQHQKFGYAKLTLWLAFVVYSCLVFYWGVDIAKSY